ncbi:MAG TPA: hypothetical protein PKM25_10370, partial [Candidatus Ozemobacteraceae bacterium]|nr:hypothetical protein [Candidatus Ozemobacteraceae bacterium]
MTRFRSIVAASFALCVLLSVPTYAQTRPTAESLAGLRLYAANQAVPGERMKPGKFDEKSDASKTDTDLAGE